MTCNIKSVSLVYTVVMAKRVTVITDLTTEDPHERDLSAATPVERTYWHILWVMKGPHSKDVAVMLGSTAKWVRTIVQRWNREGEPAMRDHRRLQKGAPPRLAP